MAGLARNTYHLKSATLVEAIVAVLIISISFSIGIAIILNCMQPFKTQDLINLDYRINQILQNTKTTKYYIDETFKYKEFTILKTVSKYENYNDIVVVDFKVRNTKNKITYERIEWIYVAE